MIRHTGGHRFCPICKKIVETRVLANGYKQVPLGGGYAKQRKIICAKDRWGNGGCGYVFDTLEIPQELLAEILGILPVDQRTDCTQRNKGVKYREGTEMEILTVPLTEY